MHPIWTKIWSTRLIRLHKLIDGLLEGKAKEGVIHCLGPLGSGGRIKHCWSV